MLYSGRMPVFYYLNEQEAEDVYLYLSLYPPSDSVIPMPRSPCRNTARKQAEAPLRHCIRPELNCSYCLNRQPSTQTLILFCRILLCYPWSGLWSFFFLPEVSGSPSVSFIGCRQRVKSPACLSKQNLRREPRMLRQPFKAFRKLLFMLMLMTLPALVASNSYAIPAFARMYAPVAVLAILTSLS